MLVFSNTLRRAASKKEASTTLDKGERSRKRKCGHVAEA
jgi:hypothetical protein